MNIDDSYWMQQTLVRYALSRERAAQLVSGIKDGLGASITSDDAWDALKTEGQIAAASFLDAALYFVGAEADTVIRVAAHSMPDMSLRREDLPAPAGIVVWEDPWPLECGFEEHGPHPLAAISWHPFDPPTDAPELESGVVIEVLSTAEMGGELADLWFTPLHTMVAGISHYGRSFPDPTHQRNSSLFATDRWIAAFWVFVQQELLQSTATRPSRAVRRAQQHAHGQEFRLINVIRLRRIHHREQEADGEESAVEWSHRWLVRGHWHRYWFGTGADRRLKPRWLLPYVKGPEDKPFEGPRPTVYDVSR